MAPSSTRSVQPLRLEPGPPRLPMAVLLAGHAGALLLLSTLPLPIPALLGLALLIGWSGWRTVARLAGRDRLSTLIWHADGRWETAAGESLKLIPPPFVSVPLIILNFADTGGRRRSLLLTAGTVGRAPLRRLRVRLRTAAEADDTGR